MRILYLSISYSIQNQNLYTDLVDELVKRGHEVTIVTSIVNKYKDKVKYNVIDFDSNIKGIDSYIKKGIHTLCIPYQFIKKIKEYLNDDDFDLIMYATPPITLNATIKFCKKKYNAKTFLMLKDIFPQNAVDLDMFKKFSPVYWFFRRKEKKLYAVSDYIGCMSKGNKEYLLEHNQIAEGKTFIFPNSIKIEDEEKIKVVNKKDKSTKFIFGGNLGKPQNVEGLLKIIKSLEEYELAKFVFIGSGTESNKVKTFQSRNFMYFDQLPREKYEEYLGNSDVGIISLDPRFTIPNIPSKLQSYMKLEKSVLAITDSNTDLRNIINESDCGWWCDASDIDLVINTIKDICENKNQQIMKGKNGYEYLSENYNVKTNVNKIEKMMEVKNCESI